MNSWIAQRFEFRASSGFLDSSFGFTSEPYPLNLSIPPPIWATLLHGVSYVLKLAVSRCRWAPSGTIKLDLTDYETAQPD